MLREAGNLNNLALAAGKGSGAYAGPVFMDSDVYKWLEAVAYVGISMPEAEEAIALIQAAQQTDGYLNSHYQVVAPQLKWQELNTGHELYCTGHLIQAAVAWKRHLNDDRLLRVSEQLVAHILSIFGPRKRIGVPGHPEIEMALVELYRETRNKDYLDLAQFFIDHRGKGLLGPNPRFGGSAYYQDRVPVRDSSEIEGHAVRAMYLNCGITDVYLETGESALLEAMQRQWSDFVEHKLYLTGGAGSRHTGEAFGHHYELPNERAYCETCAAIGSIMWNQRLLQATGEPRFADLLERTLYNGFLSGVSLTGDRFFYVNALLSRGEPEYVGRGVPDRQPWFYVACCPPNVMRLLGSLDQYLTSATDNTIRIDHYTTSTIETDSVRLRVDTEYPWDGHIAITVERTAATPWSLQLRIPAWCTDARVDGQSAQPGYTTLQREWRAGDRVQLDLAISPRITVPHPRVESSYGTVAIERGPLVYCIEHADNPNVLDLAIDPNGPRSEQRDPELLGGITTVRARGGLREVGEWPRATFAPRGHRASATSAELCAIPYYAWANRGPGGMRVWIPTLD